MEELQEKPLENLIKSIAGHSGKKAPRIAFTSDPAVGVDSYSGIYKPNRGLLPYNIAKKVRVENHLVAGILRARGNQMSMFGHIQRDRQDMGFKIHIKDDFKEHIKPEQNVIIQERINKATKSILSCGNEEGLPQSKKMNLSEFLDIQCRNGVTFGKFATEFIYEDKENTKFHRFRPVDAGTIYNATGRNDVAPALRQSSISMLERLTGVKIDIKKFNTDKCPYVQVISGTPRQTFTEDELNVYCLYPSSDVEHDGYPVTPLDTAILAVTQHSSIEAYNKLYFQNGRGSKGMLVYKSDEVDQSTIEDIKQQYSASINNVNNSFRTPIFGINKDEDVNWVTTEPQRRDGEFQYLFDQVTRNILMAFGMSPDELPGFGHLSKSTNSQALSESNTEWKLTATRDTGLRPLILKFEDFLNKCVLPKIDPELAQLCVLTLSGLDAETREAESNRLQRDMPIHMDMDEVLTSVDKKPVGSSLGGKIPFNTNYQNVVSGFVEQKTLAGSFLNSPAAYVDPLLKYKRDQFFAQNIQTMSQYNPEAVRAYYATRDDSMDLLKMLIEDFLGEE